MTEGNVPDMPAPMRISVRYDEVLQKITGTGEEEIWMGEGSTFAFALENIFMAYPDIQRHYPPGTLGFLINNMLPKPYSPLLDGDIISVVTTHV